MKETGLAVPTTQEELFDVLKTAKEKNIGTDENGNVFTTDGTPAVAATFAIATQITDFFGLSEDIKWLDDMKNGKATFKGSLEPSLDMPLELIGKEYINPQSFAAVTNVVPVLEKMRGGKVLVAFVDKDGFFYYSKDGKRHAACA